MNIWNEFVLYVSITKKDGTKNFYHVRLWSCIPYDLYMLILCFSSVKGNMMEMCFDLRAKVV